jgi:hypothetical protein
MNDTVEFRIADTFTGTQGGQNISLMHSTEICLPYPMERWPQKQRSIPASIAKQRRSATSTMPVGASNKLRINVKFICGIGGQVTAAL